jgi:hypothetical protein
MGRGGGKELLRCCWRRKRRRRRIEKILNLEVWIIYKEREVFAACTFL